MSRFICGRYTLDLSRPLVMGILNVTPDSFSDGGICNTIDKVLTKTIAHIKDGASIIDIGVEATGPGARPHRAEQGEKEQFEQSCPAA